MDARGAGDRTSSDFAGHVGAVSRLEAGEGAIGHSMWGGRLHNDSLVESVTPRARHDSLARARDADSIRFRHPADRRVGRPSSPRAVRQSSPPGRRRPAPWCANRRAAGAADHRPWSVRNHLVACIRHEPLRAAERRAAGLAAMLLAGPRPGPAGAAVAGIPVGGADCEPKPRLPRRSA